MAAGIGTKANYSFDASSNLTTLPTGGSGTYNNAGELTSTTVSGTTTNYTYNADGQQLSTAQGTTSMSSAAWNGAGQLTTYNDSNASMTNAVYNGSGVRVSTTATSSGGGLSSQQYVWNGEQMLMDSANAYIYTTSRTPVEQVNISSGTATYLLADALGSVRGIVDSTGSLTGSVSYDAWGNPLSVGGLTVNTPFGFAGGYTDSSGLIYLINRYYDPAIGQFISADPVVVDTLAPYSYGYGNPVSQVDPAGLSSTPCCSGANLPTGGGGYSYPKDSPNYVYFEWVDRYGNVIPLRKGNRQFGWIHAWSKHGIPWEIIGKTLMYGYGERIGTSRYNYNYAIRVRNRRAYEFEELDIQTTIVVGARTGPALLDGLPQGVITAFCTYSKSACPSWVTDDNWEYLWPVRYRR